MGLKPRRLCWFFYIDEKKNWALAQHEYEKFSAQNVIQTRFSNTFDRIQGKVFGSPVNMPKYTLISIKCHLLRV